MTLRIFHWFVLALSPARLRFLGGDDFYVKMEADSGEFLGTLYPLSVRKIPLNSPSTHSTDEDPGRGSGNSPKFSQ